MAKTKEVAHDETPAIISSHPFQPKGEWWSQCKVCNLSESAHLYTTNENNNARRQESS